MQHQLGRIDIVAWQGRRARDAQRPTALSVSLIAIVAGSLLLLLLRFAVGVTLPLELLQLAFALLVAASALLLMRGAVNVILRLQQR